MIEITGTIDKQDIGVGTWILVGDNGKTYELRNLSTEIKQKGLRVVVTGKIQEDVMTIAMVGSVLEIEHFLRL